MSIQTVDSQVEPLVRFAHVQKSYDGQSLVVKDLNLDIAKGEFLTLLGPSGSGKTTSLMMLAGFETPTNGRITLQGLEITSLPPYKRGIGMVFQNYALFPHMTVFDNVAYPLRARKVSDDEISQRVTSALEMVKLGPFGERMPAQLSGGQQQRVALARALVFEPELILLDEPLGALDKQLRERMQYELKQIHERLGVTMVYVTHDQEEALTMSDRIAVFDQGRIQQLAPPEELYESPTNAFVAGFIGENNTLEGDVLAAEGHVVTVRLSPDVVVTATAVDPLSAGERAVLCLRPERVALASGALDNSFDLSIERLVYLGEATRVIFSLGGQEIIAKGDPAKMPVNLTRDTVVTVGWRTADCRAFRKE